MLSGKSDTGPTTDVNPRYTALEIIAAVTQKGAYTNLALEKGLRGAKLTSEDKHLITEIVNGTIRMLKHLDWVLNLFLKKPIEKMNPWLRDILRMSLYQILFMGRIPDYAAVDSAVNLTRKKTGGQLIRVCNGVLRNIVRNQKQIKYPPRERPVDYLSVYYSHPEWMVEKWLHQYGFEITEKMLDYNNQPAGLTLRYNRLKGTREELVHILEQEKVECRCDSNIPWSIRVDSMNHGLTEMDSFRTGRFYVQDAGSMLAVSILEPQPGDLVYDLCCGVGGKSTHLAEYMHNQGRIKAFDIYEKKLHLLKDNCQRLGITILKGYRQDIVTMDSNWEAAARVLLDAPCSGLGVLRRRSDLRWHKNPAEIIELIGLQKLLLARAGQLVAKGGKIVYSTCTINTDENEQVVTEFLEKNPDFSLENFYPNLSFLPLDQQDINQATTGMLTLMPGKYSTDGMFYACMRRN